MTSVNSTELECTHYSIPSLVLACRSVTSATASQVGSTCQVEERRVAEPGSSSEEWIHRGKVFVCLARLMPGGGDSAGLRDQ